MNIDKVKIPIAAEICGGAALLAANAWTLALKSKSTPIQWGASCGFIMLIGLGLRTVSFVIFEHPKVKEVFQRIHCKTPDASQDFQRAFFWYAGTNSLATFIAIPTISKISALNLNWYQILLYGTAGSTANFALSAISHCCCPSSRPSPQGVDDELP